MNPLPSLSWRPPRRPREAAWSKQNGLATGSLARFPSGSGLRISAKAELSRGSRIAAAAVLSERQRLAAGAARPQLEAVEREQEARIAAAIDEEAQQREGRRCGGESRQDQAGQRLAEAPEKAGAGESDIEQHEAAGIFEGAPDRRGGGEHGLLLLELERAQDHGAGRENADREIQAGLGAEAAVGGEPTPAQQRQIRRGIAAQGSKAAQPRQAKAVDAEQRLDAARQGLRERGREMPIGGGERAKQGHGIGLRL